MKNNVILCGFMGCGKSTVGTLLAEKLNYTFLDSDKVIEQREKMTVSEIFAVQGEGYFRAVETAALTDLCKQNSQVIATGGGAVLNPLNADTLRDNGTVFFLDVTPETVLRRLKDDTSRPLLQKHDKESAVRELMNIRRPIYIKHSHYTINGNQNPEAVLQEIIEILNTKSSKI